MGRKAEDLTGREFNEWVVKEPLPKKENGHVRYWLCRCSCGKEQPVRADILKSGRSASCGHTHPCHSFGDRHIGWKGHGKLPLTLWSRIIRSAEARDIHFDLSIEDAWEIYGRQNCRCALSGLPIEFGHKGKPTTASLDRKDSTLGYTKENVQWVHKRINIMKGDLTDDQFIDYCQLVTLELGARRLGIRGSSRPLG